MGGRGGIKVTVSGTHLKGTTCFSDSQVTKGHTHCCFRIMEVVCRIVRPLPGVVKPALPALSQSPEAAGAPGLCPHTEDGAVLSWALPSEPFPLWPVGAQLPLSVPPKHSEIQLVIGLYHPSHTKSQLPSPVRVPPSPVSASSCSQSRGMGSRTVGGGVGGRPRLRCIAPTSSNSMPRVLALPPGSPKAFSARNTLCADRRTSVEPVVCVGMRRPHS